MVAERACIDRSAMTREQPLLFGGGRSSLRLHLPRMADSWSLESGNDARAWLGSLCDKNYHSQMSCLSQLRVTYLRSHVGCWQIYGRLPVWILRWRARLDDWYITYVRKCNETFTPKDAHIRECFLAAHMITKMWLFTSMSPRMHGQGTALDETFVTILHSAVVGSFICMYSIMTAEI